MAKELLAALEDEFDAWRGQKAHVREAVPRELLQRARAAVSVHGMERVARVTKLDRRRLGAGAALRKVADAGEPATPAYSRVSLPLAAPPPFAEVEAPNGLRVRLFSESTETLRLLWSVLASHEGRAHP